MRERDLRTLDARINEIWRTLDRLPVRQVPSQPLAPTDLLVRLQEPCYTGMVGTATARRCSEDGAYIEPAEELAVSVEPHHFDGFGFGFALSYLRVIKLDGGFNPPRYRPLAPGSQGVVARLIGPLAFGADVQAIVWGFPGGAENPSLSTGIEITVRDYRTAGASVPADREGFASLSNGVWVWHSNRC